MNLNWLVPLLLPFATFWVRRQEALILKRGVPLDDSHLEIARALGVRNPENVRLLQVDSVPVPVPQTLLSALPKRWFSFFPEAIAGMTLGYGISLHKKWGTSKLVLRHELVHVAQYERLGGVRPFLKEYLRECLSDGYPNGVLEREANVLSCRSMEA